LHNPAVHANIILTTRANIHLNVGYAIYIIQANNNIKR